MAYLPKFYMKEVFASNGYSRDVYFSNTNEVEATSDFKPFAFYKQGWTSEPPEVSDGIFFNIFYPTSSSMEGSSLLLDKPIYRLDNYKGLTPVLDNIKNQYFGGNLFCAIRDLLYLLGKTSDINSVFGYGIMSRLPWESDAALSSILNEDPKGYFRFYCTNVEKNSFNKLFHSYMLGSYALSIADFSVAASVHYSYKGSGDWAARGPCINIKNLNLSFVIVENNSSQPFYGAAQQSLGLVDSGARTKLPVLANRTQPNRNGWITYGFMELKNLIIPYVEDGGSNYSFYNRLWDYSGVSPYLLSDFARCQAGEIEPATISTGLCGYRDINKRTSSPYFELLGRIGASQGPSYDRFMSTYGGPYRATFGFVIYPTDKTVLTV